MIELGKVIFRVNPLQLFFILFCLGLAILAKSISIEMSGVTLSSFINTSFENVFAEKESFSVFKNVVLPAIFYLISCFLLLWMCITNFITLPYEETKVDITLKILLGICQAVLFGWFLFVGGKLFVYFTIFSIIILIATGMIISAFASSSDE
jgi:hypothetical protein